MIARLSGVVAEKSPGALVIMTGGVGYEVFIPLSTYYDLPDEGQETELHIKTVVREDALELFGFFSAGEKGAFELLNSVSKIGPRLALSILSGIGPGELVTAVTHKNIGRLTGIPGVGAKTAERLVLELKDKVGRLAVMAEPETAVPEAAVLDDVARDAVSALLNLGYSRSEAEKAVNGARMECGPGPDELSTLLRQSLKRLRKV